MSEVIEIRLERLSAEAFAPFGQLICACNDEPPIFEARISAPGVRTEVLGPTELMYIHYRHQPIEFSTLERHFQVTQTFVAPGGAASVMAVAPPSGRESVPEPGALRAFFVPGTVGLMLWRGTWHALTRFFRRARRRWLRLPDRCEYPARARAAAADGTPPKLTQEIDYRERYGVTFKVVDPDGLLAADTGA